MRSLPGSRSAARSIVLAMVAALAVVTMAPSAQAAGDGDWVDLTAQTIRQASAHPLYDVQAQRGTEGWAFQDGKRGIDLRGPDSWGGETRGLMEFDLGSIPSDATFESARLTLRVRSRTWMPGQDPFLRLYAFSGQGQRLDLAPDYVDTFVGQSDPIGGVGSLTISLDPQTLQALRAQNRYLGLVLVQGAPTVSATWSTLEGGRGASGLPKPQLDVEYTAVPEPASALLLTAGLLAWRRRR